MWSEPQKVSSLSYQRRQVYDIPPIKMQVCEHRSEIKCCPNCGTENSGAFPPDVPQQQTLMEKYHRLIKSGYIQHPLPQKEAGKRGVVKKSKTQNLLERFALHCEDIVRFIRDFRVPFSNNAAELAIRIMKVKQKTSGCFRSKEGSPKADCYHQKLH